MARQWQGRSRGGRAGYGVFIFLIRHFGVRTAYVLLFFVVLYFIPAAPRSTGDIWRYARRILGLDRLRSSLFVFRNYWSFGQSIIDRVAVSAGLEDSFHYEFEGFGALEGLLREGRGAIILGAHFGNWAAGEPFFSKYRTKLNLVMYDNEHSDIKKILENNRDREASFKIIPVNKDSLAHVFMITEALDRGELVCFLGDRYVNEDKLLDAEFMGHPARFPSGPFLLSARMRVPVMFYAAVRERDMTYRFIFRRLDVSVRGDEWCGMLDKFIETLEAMLKAHPEQWYNYYDFWNLRKPVSSRKK